MAFATMVQWSAWAIEARRWRWWWRWRVVATDFRDFCRRLRAGNRDARGAEGLGNCRLGDCLARFVGSNAKVDNHRARLNTKDSDSFLVDITHRFGNVCGKRGLKSLTGTAARLDCRDVCVKRDRSRHGVEFCAPHQFTVANTFATDEARVCLHRRFPGVAAGGNIAHTVSFVILVPRRVVLQEVEVAEPVPVLRNTYR